MKNPVLYLFAILVITSCGNSTEAQKAVMTTNKGPENVPSQTAVENKDGEAGPNKIICEEKLDNGLVYRVQDFIWSDDFGMFKQAGDEDWKGVVLYVSLENTTDHPINHNSIVFYTSLCGKDGKYDITNGRGIAIKSTLVTNNKIPKSDKDNVHKVFASDGYKEIPPHSKIGAWCLTFPMKKSETGPYHLEFKEGVDGKTHNVDLKL